MARARSSMASRPRPGSGGAPRAGTLLIKGGQLGQRQACRGCCVHATLRDRGPDLSPLRDRGPIFLEGQVHLTNSQENLALPVVAVVSAPAEIDAEKSATGCVARSRSLMPAAHHCGGHVPDGVLRFSWGQRAGPGPQPGLGRRRRGAPSHHQRFGASHLRPDRRGPAAPGSSPACPTPWPTGPSHLRP